MTAPAPTYTCDLCHETFEYEWSDEEAVAEMEATFGPVPPADRAIVCDDCYQTVMG